MTEKIIKIKDLKKSFWKNLVLDNLNLEIEKWDFFALLWYNWAWKSTTINILTNLLKKDSWEIFINSINIDKNFAKARNFLWVVPQEFNFDPFAKVIDICMFQAWYYSIPKKVALENAEKYLKNLWLWEKRFEKAKNLSGWMKRRLMIARALIHNPKILILDEPTAWVDVELRQSMWDFLKKLNDSGTTIILTTHYLEEVEMLCKNVAIISKWKIIENTKVKDILKSLDEETFIFEIEKNNLDFEKKFAEKYKKISENEFEMTLKSSEWLNKIFDFINSNNLKIFSVREKQNRMEALFFKYLKK